MTCPTCDHTMGVLCYEPDNEPVYLCPRCGTAKVKDVQPYVPKLVERCRKFEPTIRPDVNTFTRKELWKHWISMGLREAINKPEDRPS